ncbi:MAG: ubiquinol-cytochrome c reductase iron-sulfur subunit [Chloroflexi bacterium]|nr:ubiquinol-cytochrome c reductase iron-sulfur subunit [Chloroflexota bacterium]
MATQNQQSSGEGNGTSRRKFLRNAIWTAAGLLTIESLAAMFASLWPKAQVGSAATRINAGKVSDYSVGSLTRFPDGGFYLSRVESGFLALSQVCTHLGCVVPWKEDEQSEDKLAPKGRFNCPCHGSIFDRYGQVIVAPATRPMDLYRIQLDGDKLIVETSTVIRRQTYDESQVLKV